MSSRTTTSVVSFLHPFVVAGYSDGLPAGDYTVLADDGVMLRAYRRTATFPLINCHAGKSERRAVDDLKSALAQDQAPANTTTIKNSAAALSPSEERK